jgi:purine-binding chemotaxis protein CheW
MSLSQPAGEIETTKKGTLLDGQAVLFTLAGCELGIPIGLSKEIIRVTDITQMPKAPHFLEGVINLRGKIIPVLDLKKRFHMPLLDWTEETRILVVEWKDLFIGLLVDKVVEVVRFSPAAVEGTDEDILNIGAEYIEGLLRLGPRLVVLLKMEKISSIEELRSIPDKETISGEEGKVLGH